MEMRGGSLLANLLTVGNGICGFAAIVKLSQVQPLADGSGFVNPENFKIAAYLILLGMVFDVFDGKVARMSKGGTELGAQLDSFCDLITFGLVPAFMIVQLNIVGGERWQGIVWFFSLAYFLGALLRLARFNVENSPDESAHLCFKGLPSPGAAGCVASLVVFQHYVLEFEKPELVWLANMVEEGALKTFAGHITLALPFLALLLGFSMVSSRLKFEHFGSKLFARGYSFDFLTYTIFGLVVLAIVPEVVLPFAFCGYLVWTPIVTVWRHLTGRWFGGGGTSELASDPSDANVSNGNISGAGLPGADLLETGEHPDRR
jgi:CDP-diacylglycerol--serine O-phosphatidyltransferase